MNKIYLHGRLTRDPETRVTSKDMYVTKFTVAVDRMKEGADFVPCTAFGKTAETIDKYIRKGSEIIVEGRWTSGSYENKDGKKVYTNDCTVDRFEFCSGGKQTAAAEEDEPVQERQLEGFEALDEEVPF